MKEPYFICIGTTLSILDSVAPKIGTRLKEKGYHVMGTEEEELNGLNLAVQIKAIEALYDSYRVITLDATKNRSKAQISKSLQPLRPGSGIKKSLPTIYGEKIVLHVFNDIFDDEELIYVQKEDCHPLTEELEEHINTLADHAVVYIEKYVLREGK